MQIIFVIKDELGTVGDCLRRVFLETLCDSFALQPRAVTTRRCLTAKMLMLLNLCLCVCVCVSICHVCLLAWARWKTPFCRRCLNGHAVLWRPFIPSCYAAEVNTARELLKRLPSRRSARRQKSLLGSPLGCPWPGRCASMLTGSWPCTVVLYANRSRPALTARLLYCKFGVLSAGSWTSPLCF